MLIASFVLVMFKGALGAGAGASVGGRKGFSSAPRITGGGVSRAARSFAASGS